MIRPMACLLAAHVSLSSLAEERTPEQVARAYFQGLQAGDWKRVAAEFSPEAQARFRALIAEVMEAVPAAEVASVRTTLFGAPHTPEQVAALSNAEFLAKVLGTILGRALGGAQLQRVDVVGTVTERQGVVHVVCRSFMGSASAADVAIERMVVVSLEQAPSGWGVALSGEIKGVAAMLKAQMAKKVPGTNRQ